jgi:hypothetical protein
MDSKLSVHRKNYVSCEHPVANAYFLVTFSESMGQCCPVQRTTFLSEQEDTSLQWLFKWNNAPAAAENLAFKRLC